MRFFLWATLALVTPAFAHETLNSVIDELMHREVLLTVARIKPMALLPHENALNLEKTLNEARQAGRVDPDLGWFVHRTAAAGGRGHHSLYVYRRSLVEAVVRDPKSFSFLEPFGFSGADNVEQIILRLQTWLESSAELVPSAHRSVLLGIFLGYPKSEILAFAREDAKAALTGRNVHRRVGQDFTRVYSGPDFNLGTIVDFTGKSGLEIKALQSGATHAVERYRAARELGYSPLEIVNGWDGLAEAPKAATYFRCQRLLL